MSITIFIAFLMSGGLFVLAALQPITSCGNEAAVALFVGSVVCGLSCLLFLGLEVGRILL